MVRHVLEDLGCVLAQVAKFSSTAGACLRVRMHDLFSGELVCQRATSGPLGLLLRCGSNRGGLGGKACLQILDRQLHLQKLPVEGFG